MGLIVTMVSDLNLTIEDIKKQITIVPESPFVKIETTEDKYLKFYNNIKDWILAYVDVGDKVLEFIEKIEALPDKAQEIADGAKDELANSGLGMMEIVKIVKGTLNTVSKVKEVS
jgi:hypothetical protein